MSISAVQNQKKRKREQNVKIFIPAWVSESSQNRRLYQLAIQVINQLPVDTETSDFKAILNDKDLTNKFVNTDHKDLTDKVITVGKEKIKQKHAEQNERTKAINCNVKDIENQVASIEAFLENYDKNIDAQDPIPNRSKLNHLYDLAKKCKPNIKQKGKRVDRSNTDMKCYAKFREKQYAIKDKHSELVSGIKEMEQLTNDSTENIFTLKAFLDCFKKVSSLCRNNENGFSPIPCHGLGSNIEADNVSDVTIAQYNENSDPMRCLNDIYRVISMPVNDATAVNIRTIFDRLDRSFLACVSSYVAPDRTALDIGIIDDRTPGVTAVIDNANVLGKGYSEGLNISMCDLNESVNHIDASLAYLKESFSDDTDAVSAAATNDINDDNYVDEDSVAVDATCMDIIHTPAAKLRKRPEFQLLSKLYTVYQSSNGNLGGNGYFGPTYGELTICAMYKVIRTMINYCSLTRDSVFLDVGSGLGKPCLAACIIAGTKKCFGIEVESIRHALAINNLMSALKSNPEVFDTKRIILLEKDVTSVPTWTPCTHMYSFDAVFPAEVMIDYAAAFNSTRSAEYLVSFHKPSSILGFGFSVQHIHSVKGLRFHGSTESRTAYFYKQTSKINAGKIYQGML